MPGHPLGEVLRRLRPAAHGSADRPDADLLVSYAARRDEAAFEALVHRHGPMVLGVCRRVLRCDADAEDAFQATFLVLAHKAGVIRDRAAVGKWLYGVASNVARRARATNRRRQALERAAGARPRPVADDDGWWGLDTLVADELGRLPDRYRIPIVSCGLEGKTIREAAADLGWSPGTVATRLARGRDLLARRLGRHGVVVPAALLAAPAAGPASAAVPEALVESTVRLGAAAGVVPARVHALANEVMRSMFLTKLKIAATVLLAAGLGAAAVASRPARAEAVAQPDPPPAKKVDTPAKKADSPAPKREPTAARKLLDQLRELKPQGGGEALSDDSAVVLRDLIQLGPAAVPDVAAELDATTDPFMLRCLGFAARGIGDKRLVPALIRTFPKTCLPPTSDYGQTSNDPALLAFLQAHSNRPQDGGTRYSFGRPVNEFRTALQKLTGSKHGEDELVHVFLTGGAAQKAQQRELYRRCAERWAAWWEKNAKDHVADPRYATVNLPPRAADMAPPGAAPFPRGPRVVIGGGTSNCILQSVHAPGAKYVFKDLDTGREGNLPPRLRVANGQPERVDDIAAWAAEEGYDLMGTEYTPPGGDKPHYVLRGLGLTAWQIDPERRPTLGGELRAAGPLDMGKQTGGLLAQFDAAAGRYRPEETGLFLFRTRENGFGWIFVGVEVHDDGLQPGVPAAGDQELSPIAFHKGRRY
ncbi:MAG TPA: RNA polymerase sigma factor, partial [Urbifossiella sp.]|nr:RNA polymerase sigma factor [Urbifossiella sp.]